MALSEEDMKQVKTAILMADIEKELQKLKDATDSGNMYFAFVFTFAAGFFFGMLLMVILR